MRGGEYRLLLIPVRNRDLRSLFYEQKSVFIATLGVGLLSYTHDIFSDRPSGSSAPKSDSIITAFFFVSVILAVVGAMEFTALQLTVTRSRGSSSPASARLPSVDGRDATGTDGKDIQVENADHDSFKRAVNSIGKGEGSEVGSIQGDSDPEAGNDRAATVTDWAVDLSSLCSKT